MADAGFYVAENGGVEGDLARCYYCRRELDGWEPEDDPWTEHKRRPCPFIKKGKTASNLTVKDAMELEAERAKTLAINQANKLATEECKTVADKTKREIIKLGTKSSRGRRKGKY